MPIYVRAGAIIPVDPVRQYTAQPVTEPTTLRVYPRRQRRSSRCTTTTGSVRSI